MTFLDCFRGKDRWGGWSLVEVGGWCCQAVRLAVVGLLLAGPWGALLCAAPAEGVPVLQPGEKFTASLLAKQPCPVLNSPGGAGDEGARADKLAKELWKYIDTMTIKLDAKDAAAGRAAILELQELHRWISQAPGYGNLVLASACEQKICEAVGKGLMAGTCPPAEARAVLDALLTNRVKGAGLARFMDRELPEFASAKEDAEALRRGETVDVIQASANLVKEQGQDFLNFPRSSVALLETQDGARVLQYSGMGQNVVYMVKGLTEYQAAGGDLAAGQKMLLADLPLRIPKFFKEAEAGTGRVWHPMGLVHARDLMLR